ncbi:MAG TPA: TrkA family potassium uptake protein [Chloroflexota bacterium]|nr:TrkA family potassium uptake protein [Chloroflexota bacterium]
MKVVVVGCGRVGSRLALALARDGDRVAVIDKNPVAFRRLGPTFSGLRITGVGFDRTALAEAGLPDVDALAAVTNGDNTNFVVAAVARRYYRVPRVVARIYDPSRADIFRHLGIPTISSTIWGANRLKEMLVQSRLAPVLSIASGDAEVFEADLPAMLEGTSVADLDVPGEILVSAIVRTGRAIVPRRGTRFERGDVLQITALSASFQKLRRLLEGE